jgi:cytochrome c-type biogenesis protein CcmH/NrfG
MKKQAASNNSSWTNVQIYTAIVVVLILGALGGYLLHGSGSASDSSTASTAADSVNLPPPMASSPVQNLNTQVQPLLTRLASNPKDVGTLIALGNLYYDNAQWGDAIGYYTRALNETPSNPDVRTDMGTAYFNSGDPDRALQAFNRALKDDPRHGQTLYNIGVVKLNAKHDAPGAIAAWEKLLQVDPNYKDRAAVETALANAKAQLK